MSWFSDTVGHVGKYLGPVGARNIVHGALGYTSDMIFGKGTTDRIIDKYTGKTEEERYQKQLQLQYAAWKREDTAVQRRADDLRAAGLSPVLAAGSAASSSGPISLSRTSDAGDPVALAQAFMNLVQQKRNIDLSMAQEELIKAETDNKDYDSLAKLYNAKKAKSEIPLIEADTVKKGTDAAIDWYELELAKKAGVSVRNPSTLGKMGKDIQGAYGNQADFMKKHNELLKEFQELENKYMDLKQQVKP